MKIILYSALHIAVFYIDKKHYERIKQYKWTISVHKITGYIYASAYVNGKNIFLHKFVLGLELDDSIHVDHINGDTKDCRERNLRPATKAQNAMNSKKQSNITSSRYKGVAWAGYTNAWRARCNRIHLGYFIDEEDAARAYDQAAVRMFGEFARLNFPVSP